MFRGTNKTIHDQDGKIDSLLQNSNFNRNSVPPVAVIAIIVIIISGDKHLINNQTENNLKCEYIRAV